MKDTILNFNVTYQNNTYDKNLKLVTIGNFLSEIKNMKYSKEINKLRKYLTDEDFDNYDKGKKELPAVTFSGNFSNTRRIETLIEYNEICVIDIDKISDQEITKYLSIFQSDAYVFTYWLSPSGRGIKGLIKFKYSNQFDKSNSNNYHKYAFTKLYEYFFEKYNIEIDKSGSDITRLCFISSDSNLVMKDKINEFNIDYQVLSELPIKKKGKEKLSINASFILKEHMNPKGKNEQSKRTEIQKIIKYLRKNNLSITNNYDDWLRVAFAISSTFTYDLGEKYYLQLCRLDGIKHNEEKSKIMLQNCYKTSQNQISFGTIQFLFDKLKGEVGESRTEEVLINVNP